MAQSASRNEPKAIAKKAKAPRAKSSTSKIPIPNLKTSQPSKSLKFPKETNPLRAPDDFKEIKSQTGTMQFSKKTNSPILNPSYDVSEGNELS